MTLTLGRAAEIVESTLGGSPAGFSAKEIANLAGDWMVNARDWRFLENSTATLDTAIGTYVDLPSDLKAIVRIFPTNNLTSTVHLTGPSELLALETSPPATSSQYRAVLSYREPSAGGVRLPIIRIWPDVTEAEEDKFTIWYHATWPRAAEDETVLPVVQWLEGIYIEALRLYAKGLVEEDAGGDPHLRLEAFQGSMMWAGAVKTDERMQRTYGRAQNTAVGMARRQGYHRNWDEVAEPGA